MKTTESTRGRADSTASRDSATKSDAGVMSGRVLELDALRGLACLAILFHHFKPHLLPFGWAAVDLFFILSGYLITAIILKNGRQKHFLFHFYMRRGLRIWPIYYLTVLVVAAASPWLPRTYDYAGLPYILTYTQEVGLHWSRSTPAFSEYLMHTWSLAVEEQFYLIWPVLVCLVGRRGVVSLALALATAAVCARSSEMYWRVLLTRADGLALGALLAALFTARKAIREHSAVPKVFAAIGLGAVAYLAFLIASGGMSKPEAPPWPGPSLLAVNVLGAAIVGLVIYYQGRPALSVLRRPRLVKIGQLSYGLYIYHYVLMLLSDDLARAFGLGGRPFWREALTAAVIYAVAALSWRYVEMPLLRLKDRFDYRPTARAEASKPHFTA
ncbi:O-acetyltransferase OatA [Paludisphaera borealis]|uniref:O-acetyltransferase OatA n=1 Tax=Paludisphaera borealis TaxID=1387353 RepID=A0A1U7CII6_9BACT|nr:O-acetyltransferase OatA [Paludisphaera borealis]